MALVLAPSFDDHTREEVEAHLEVVRMRRIAAAIEFAQSKLIKLEGEEGSLSSRLIRNYELLGRALDRLDRDIEAVESYLRKCQMVRGEMDLVLDRIELAKR